MSRTHSPREDADILARWGTDNLTRVIAIDSQSNASSQSIPSSEGQRILSDHLRGFFTDLGYEVEQDDSANVIVTIPSNLPPSAEAPAVAMMVHLDTSEGTLAVPLLETTEAWDGGRIPYPQNDRLQITAANYPETTCFKGDDLLHGPGRYPIGLDDKLGMAELMTLAQLLKSNPEMRHGTLVLVFRPDEEIGRMAAVEGLAEELARRGVRYGYTIDGIEPFEINVENFNAAQAQVTIAGKPLDIGKRAALRVARFRIAGVNTHGATAKPEGHCNATVLWTRVVGKLADRGDIWPVEFATNAQLECNAEVAFLLGGESPEALDATERALVAALEAEIEPHGWKGAYLEPLGSEPADAAAAAPSDALVRIAGHLQTFLSSPFAAPLLAEDSEGFEGYSNPHAIAMTEGGASLRYRMRDFDPDVLVARQEHIRQACKASDIPDAALVIEEQYINMGPKMAAYPELVTWAEEALRAAGQEPVRRPIRGGTGVDPFLARDIPVANLGTGYFAPESEKEFTSRQNIARHALWLTHLVQVIAAPAPSK